MQAWVPENSDFSREWPLYALRLGLVAVGSAGWLIQSWPRPAPTAAVAVLLAVVVVCDVVLHARLTGRWPVAVLIVQAGAALAALRLGATAPLALPAYTPVLAAANVLSEPVLGLWAAGLAAATAAEALAAGLPGGDALVLGTGALVAGGIARLHTRHREERERHLQALEALERAQARLLELAARSRDAAAERERQRLLGEVHDTLGHALTANLLQVQVARRLIESDPAAAAQRLAAVEESLRGALAEVRRALRHALNPAHLPLAAALRVLAHDWAAAGGPRVELEFDPDETTVSDLPADVADVVYRAVQEALTNAVRHGGARVVRIRAAATAERLLVAVKDDGAGAQHFVPGMGLGAMTARVQEVGGTLRFRTAPGAGFTVEIGVRRR